jgi:hypothetical protein
MVAWLLRYEVAAGGGELSVYRLDRWTGTITACGVKEIKIPRS